MKITMPIIEAKIILAKHPVVFCIQEVEENLAQKQTWICKCNDQK